jgi:hypothetical protein
MHNRASTKPKLPISPTAISPKDRFYVAMQAREQTLGSKSVFFLSRTKHSRAIFRPSATKVAVELKPRSLRAMWETEHFRLLPLRRLFRFSRQYTRQTRL